MAYTSTRGNFRSICFRRWFSSPAIVGALFFALAHRAKELFFVLGFGLILAEVFVVRNLFGLTFVGGVAIAFLWLASSAGKGLQQIAAYFVDSVSLVVFSRGDYLFTPTAQTAIGTMPSDVAHIAEALFLPYWTWGAMWLVLATLFGHWCSNSLEQSERIAPFKSIWSAFVSSTSAIR